MDDTFLSAIRIFLSYIKGNSNEKHAQKVFN